MTPPGASLWRNFPVYQIFGANTNVGKTVFSTILCRHLTRRDENQNIWYLKPVSTGPLQDADTKHLGTFAPRTKTQNFYQFDAAVSPHIAANTEVRDDDLLQQTAAQIIENVTVGSGCMFVETAGGPHSPGPSGTSQVDIYRPLRLPTIFVADWHLGGISTSISAFESLKLRGLDVAAVTVLKDSFYMNYEYFQSYFKDRGIPVLAIPQPPERSQENDEKAMEEFYNQVDEGSSEVQDFVGKLDEKHQARLDSLEGMSTRAYSRIWWPFAQHTALSPQAITTIDSAYGDYFQTYKQQSRKGKSQNNAHRSDSSLLQSSVDGSSSWWTQGLGHGNPDLTMAAAEAAGRYGHVMFADSIHEPALSLADRIVEILGNPRLKRVFYSDNGSTGMEVGVKMALTASCKRYGWNPGDENLEIIGLQNSYHGDTIGAMDMSEPSVFNGRISWYKGRGYWFDCPKVIMRKGQWIVEKPEKLKRYLGSDKTFDSLQDIFDKGRDYTDDATLYGNYIRQTLDHLIGVEKRRFGALVMETVVLGAGGMMLIDPLFQRALANVVRSLGSPPPDKTSDRNVWTGLPIVADEVFTGLYRLGHKSSSSLLHIKPDISVHAKLLTGGLVPLAVTVASESIFEAFLAESKADCLLHGHSYTAHAIGCAVAVKSLEILQNLDEGGKWDAFKENWSSSAAESTSDKKLKIWSCWSKEFVKELSHATNKVDDIWTLGSVLSMSIRDEGGGGYASNAAKSLQTRLKENYGQGWNLHSRVLGNVLYLMASQTSSEQDVRLWEARVKKALGI